MEQWGNNHRQHREMGPEYMQGLMHFVLQQQGLGPNRG